MNILLLSHLAPEFLKLIQLLFGLHLHLLQSDLRLLHGQLGLVQVDLIHSLKWEQTYARNIHLKINSALLTTILCLVPLTFVRQLLLDERLQVREEGGKVSGLEEDDKITTRIFEIINPEKIF